MTSTFVKLPVIFELVFTDNPFHVPNEPETVEVKVAPAPGINAYIEPVA